VHSRVAASAAWVLEKHPLSAQEQLDRIFKMTVKFSYMSFII